MSEKIGKKIKKVTFPKSIALSKQIRDQLLVHSGFLHPGLSIKPLIPNLDG